MGKNNKKQIQDVANKIMNSKKPREEAKKLGIYKSKDLREAILDKFAQYGITDSTVAEKAVKLLEAKSGVYSQGELVGKEDDHKTQLNALKLVIDIMGAKAGDVRETETHGKLLDILYTKVNQENKAKKNIIDIPGENLQSNILHEKKTDNNFGGIADLAQEVTQAGGATPVDDKWEDKSDQSRDRDTSVEGVDAPVVDNK